MNCGLNYIKIRKLTYELAVKNTWDQKQMAGTDWMKAVQKRNETLSLRTPEATSLSRGTGFNRQNVIDFFTNLKNIFDRETFDASETWNIDETNTQPFKTQRKKQHRRVKNKYAK